MKSFKKHSSGLLFLTIFCLSIHAQDIPLPEHPRPDFQRDLWQNLNGEWEFAFDALDVGLEEGWNEGEGSFEKTILVPFPWGSNLSGLEDEADIGWYRKEISIDPEWEGKRIFVTVGASDWETSIWVDGYLLGKHQGGYVPFSFEITEHVRFGQAQSVVIRVDDVRRDFTLYGKQGYGNARGIWQTIYLEARGEDFLENLHFSPDIDQQKTGVTAYLSEKSNHDLSLSLQILTPGKDISKTVLIPAGKEKISFDISIPDPRLWNLDDPYLYEVEATLGEDVVRTYFGMRKISVIDLPGSDYPYIALNNEPIYLQLALDQSYHPDGFYTFPDDQFIKEEIQRSKSIGLNGIRTHIKVEVPRKLYWADKLGLLVMEDLPNSWGEPEAKMQAESDYTLRQMIHRDYNHPSIFSWVVFNETWGLYSSLGKDENGNEKRSYLPETQDWVASMYYLAKSLDQTRLVEDNSICCGRGHTETDINSWHAYLPGWEWEAYLKHLTENTYQGSTHNFEKGFTQGRQPNINSECGNVWGYEGSTGDVDWSWDYHRMLNSFRMYPKVAGWLYTEHHDVINEWNGYWRFDRTNKETGLGEIMEGMSLNDLHAAVYLSTGNEICQSVKEGEKVEVPLYLSSMTGKDYGDKLFITYELDISNRLGETSKLIEGSLIADYTPWMQGALMNLPLNMPEMAGLACLKLSLSDGDGNILHRNFKHFEVLSGHMPADTRIVSVSPEEFSDEQWSLKQWNVLEGKKVNGAGTGFFEYTFKLPENIEPRKLREVYILMELSAKELFVKDQEDYQSSQDFMRGSKVSPSANPNAYPMTDESFFPSEVSFEIGGKQVYSTVLPDDPADHRGVLSWHHQIKDRKLREAGSYGYLVKVPIKKALLKAATEEGVLKVKIQTIGEGGVAVYGKEFGRYALDPSLVLEE